MSSVSTKETTVCSSISLLYCKAQNRLTKASKANSDGFNSEHRAIHTVVKPTILLRIWQDVRIRTCGFINCKKKPSKKLIEVYC